MGEIQIRLFITPIFFLVGRGRSLGVNCQLSTVNCQLLNIGHKKDRSRTIDLFINFSEHGGI
ncbi:MULTISPECIES: hypothetical protein [unclassified Microcoleus]|uniref:hypothetical protein n=1 Tax=unclassified Microcoleus TaxID=2642155 RepID=UPI0025F58B36|nr:MULTISPECIES: hypothetical protein [unclassified Microcoleus]